MATAIRGMAVSEFEPRCPLRAAADVISFAAAFLQKPPLIHFAAAPFQTATASLGCGLAYRPAGGILHDREDIDFDRLVQKEGHLLKADVLLFGFPRPLTAGTLRYFNARGRQSRPSAKGFCLRQNARTAQRRHRPFRPEIVGSERAASAFSPILMEGLLRFLKLLT